MGRSRNDDAVLLNDRALRVLARELRMDAYDHAILSGWVSIDVIRSGNAKARQLVKSIEAMLDRGGRVSFLIGGIISKTDLNGFLLELRSVLGQRALREHFDAGRLVFATDNRSTRRVHAKVWAFGRGNVCNRLYVGSYNLSAGSFFRTIEAASVTSGSTALVKEMLANIETGRITPHQFASVEDVLERPPKLKAPAKDPSTLPYLAGVRRPPGKVKPGVTNPLPARPLTSDCWVVLKDPSRGEKSGYRIPEQLLVELFGKEFLAREQNATGIIEPPRVLIVPFPLDLAKAFQSQRNALSQVIVTNAHSTSVGYVVSDLERDLLQDALAKQASKSGDLVEKLRAFAAADTFPAFLSAQVVEQIRRLGRYAPQVALDAARVKAKAKPYLKEILSSARGAAKKILERLANEKEVSFIALDVVLDYVDGIDRHAVEQELGLADT